MHAATTPAPRYDRRGVILLVAGAVVAIGAVLGFMAGVSYLFGFPNDDPATGTAILGVCGVVPLVPGRVRHWFGYRDRSRAERMRAVEGYVTAYRRIRMTDLAAHLHLTPAQTEPLVTEAIGSGGLAAFIDAATNEVVAANAVTQERFVGPCPRCGGQVDKGYMSGRALRCPFCGTEFVARLPTDGGGAGGP